MDERVNGRPDPDEITDGSEMAFKMTASMWGAIYGMSGKAWRRREEFNRRYPTVFMGGFVSDEKFSAWLDRNPEPPDNLVRHVVYLGEEPVDE